MTQRSGSPEVNVLGGRGTELFPKPDQPGGLANRRAVAKANGSSDEKAIPHEADLRGNRSCQESRLYSMARAGAEGTEKSTHRGSRRIEGGNSGKYSSESSEGVEVGQDDPLNVKDRVYNRRCREMRRRSPHWRMRSPSDEGRNNITRPERGPLGTGGDAAAGGPHTEADELHCQWRSLRTEQTQCLFGGMAGSALTSTDMRKAPLQTARCLLLEAVPGKTRRTEF